MSYGESRRQARKRTPKDQIRGRSGEELRWRHVTGGDAAADGIETGVAEHGRQRPEGYVTSVR